MSRKTGSRIPPVTATQEHRSLPPTIDTASARLTTDHVERWARWIVDNDGELPDELSRADSDRVVVEVRHQLRDRLIRLIARAIALQLHREGPDRSESQDD